ncbi:MAG: phosphopantothenoylcysteine decarboxylase [Planctomycetota bacterium]
MSGPRTRGRPGAGRRVVVTAGPTREHLDPVRYLSNESSGKMGFAIAREARRQGATVVLIAGPVSLSTPRGVERVDVTSGREMLAATRAAFARADALFMCAAVADWRPRRKRAGKWRQKDGGREVASLELVRNPDILATIARRKGGKLVVGFALETGGGMARARAKLHRKGADYIVLNDAAALGADRTSVAILGRDGSLRVMADRPKREVAAALVRLPPVG